MSAVAVESLPAWADPENFQNSGIFDYKKHIYRDIFHEINIDLVVG